MTSSATRREVSHGDDGALLGWEGWEVQRTQAIGMGLVQSSARDDHEFGASNELIQANRTGGRPLREGEILQMLRWGEGPHRRHG